MCCVLFWTKYLLMIIYMVVYVCKSYIRTCIDKSNVILRVDALYRSHPYWQSSLWITSYPLRASTMKSALSSTSTSSDPDLLPPPPPPSYVPAASASTVFIDLRNQLWLSLSQSSFVGCVFRIYASIAYWDMLSYFCSGSCTISSCHYIYIYISIQLCFFFLVV